MAWISTDIAPIRCCFISFDLFPLGGACSDGVELYTLVHASVQLFAMVGPVSIKYGELEMSEIGRGAPLNVGGCPGRVLILSGQN